ncbi:PQQ-dependent sugar dehydrogenase [Erwinia aphidicola]
MTRYLLLPALAASLLLSPALRAEKITVQELQSGLDHPWALAFLPGEEGVLITERAGQLRRWQPGSGLSQPISGVPQVWAQRQGACLMWRWRRTLPAAVASGSATRWPEKMARLEL